MGRWFRRFLGLALCPVAFILTTVLVRVGHASLADDRFWVAWGGGAACWCAVAALLPRPFYLYVLGHELTHAVTSVAFGGRVRRIKVTGKGGHVVVTKTNFVVALAPYVVPFYGVLVVLIYGVAKLFGDPSRFAPLFHLLLGASYGFHASLTWHVLQMPQSDLEREGYFFSAIVIWIGNVALLLVAIPLLTSGVGFLDIGRWMVEVTQMVWAWVSVVVIRGVQRIRAG